MITTRCPFCANEIRIPDSILGKKVRCKNTSCQQVFTAAEAEQAAAAPVRSAPAYAPVPSPEPLLEWDRPEESEVPEEKPARRAQPASFRGEGDGSAKNYVLSQGNYPNLLQYLGWARRSARVQLIFLLVVAALILVGSFLSPLAKDLPPGGAATSILFGLMTSAVLALAAYSLYVLTMAIIEFVHVIVDIEANTRRIADSRE